MAFGIPSADDLKNAITQAGGTLTTEAEAAIEKALSAATVDITGQVIPAAQAALSQSIQPLLDRIDKVLALVEKLDGAAFLFSLGKGPQ